MKIVGVKLNEGSKTYYFDAADVNVHEKCTVIVETEKGLQYGTVVSFVSDEDITVAHTDSIAKNLFNAYLIGAHIHSNLIDIGYLTPLNANKKPE